jgi:hypothetical protein
MECLAIIDSANHAMMLSSILERKGYVFEVVSTPCQIARGGCGYSIKFPYEYSDMLINEGKLYGVYISEIYRVIPMLANNRYEKIY